MTGMWRVLLYCVIQDLVRNPGQGQSNVAGLHQNEFSTKQTGKHKTHDLCLAPIHGVAAEAAYGGGYSEAMAAYARCALA